MINKRLLDEFISRTQTLRSENTAKTYEQALSFFFPDNIDLSSNYIISKISEFKAKGNAPNTIKLRLRALNEFIKFVDRFEPVTNKQDLADIIKGFKGEEKVKECLTKDEVIRLIKCATNDRDKVIISLLATSGIRVSELVGLNADDLQGNHIHIRDTKNSTERLVTIPVSMVNLLKEYISKHKLSNVLFQNKHGERLAVETVQQMIKRISRLADVGNVSPHAFRHYFCTTLSQKSIETETIMSQSGHKSMQALQKYLHTNSERKQLAANKMNDILEE
jgi:integrase/recombinase XerD